jgi:hypothetical protein
MSGALPHHAIIGEVNDLSTARTLARRLLQRSGVVRDDVHAPRANRAVALQLPSLKPSPGHDGTPTHGRRISRSSRRNCLLRAMVKLPNDGNGFPGPRAYAYSFSCPHIHLQHR